LHAIRHKTLVDKPPVTPGTQDTGGQAASGTRRLRVDVNKGIGLPQLLEQFTKIIDIRIDSEGMEK
jgi:hypothetical protein